MGMEYYLTVVSQMFLMETLTKSHPFVILPPLLPLCSMRSSFPRIHSRVVQGSSEEPCGIEMYLDLRDLCPDALHRSWLHSFPRKVLQIFFYLFLSVTSFDINPDINSPSSKNPFIFIQPFINSLLHSSTQQLLHTYIP